MILESDSCQQTLPSIQKGISYNPTSREWKKGLWVVWGNRIRSAFLESSWARRHDLLSPEPTHGYSLQLSDLRETLSPEALSPSALCTLKNKTSLLLSLYAASKSFLSTVYLGFCQLTIPTHLIYFISVIHQLPRHSSLFIEDSTPRSVFPSTNVLPSSQVTSGTMWTISATLWLKNFLTLETLMTFASIPHLYLHFHGPNVVNTKNSSTFEIFNLSNLHFGLPILRSFFISLFPLHLLFYFPENSHFMLTLFFLCLSFTFYPAYILWCHHLNHQLSKVFHSLAPAHEPTLNLPSCLPFPFQL